MSALRPSRLRVPAICLATAFAAASILQPSTVAAQAARSAQASSAALARIRALNGAMPPSFDVYPDDACAGAWDITDRSGPITVTILRYAGLPVAHVAYPSGVGFNAVVQRLAVHTIKFGLNGASYTMQCNAGGALVDRAVGDSHTRLAIRPGDPSPPAPPLAAPAARVAQACDDPTALQSIRKRENDELRRKGTMITLTTVLNPSTLHHDDAESSCLAVAAFSDGTRLPITYTLTPDEISWNVGSSGAAPPANPLLGSWIGVDDACVGARWSFLPTSLTIYPVPGDRRKPKTFDKVSYDVREHGIVEVLIDGRRNSSFLVIDGIFANGRCMFRHQ